MKYHLVVTDREVIDLAAFCKAIRLELMPLFITCILLAKIDMKKDTLITSLFYDASVVFSNVCYVKNSSIPLGRKLLASIL